MDELNFDGPVLIIGGPYGNLEATEAVLAAGAALGIPAERTICTGDVVAYCADPAATVAAIRAAGVRVVMGNVEQALGNDASECGCDFSVGSTAAADARSWYAFAGAEIDAGARRWMAGLPDAIYFTLARRRLVAVHGAPSRINRFLYASSPAAELTAEIAASGCDGVISGHCGLPFTRVIEGRLWVSAGAVGMPANDGTPRTWFSLLQPDGDGILVEHRALAYDHRRAAAKMRARGLPEGYARAIESGICPNPDILPAVERARGGIALAPEPVAWGNRAAHSASADQGRFRGGARNA